MRVLGVVGLLGAILLSSCGSGSLPLDQAGPDVMAGLSEFPSPTEIVRQVSSEPTYSRTGAEFLADGVPLKNVSADGAGAAFTPDWNPDGEPATYEMAYALYIFELTGFSQGRYLTNTWSAPPDEGEMMIGLGNRDSDRWEWYPAVANPADEERLLIEDLAPYMDESERFIAAVALTGSGEYTLDEIRLDGQPPEIFEVDQVGFDPGGDATFSLTLVGGSGELSYFWNFGDGAVPETSTDPAPTVALTLPGTYNAEVRVENELGFQELDFVMVSGTPTIGDVRPRQGMSGAEVQFEADVSGSEPLTYAWDFAGGADPNTSSEPSPTVTLGEPGEYECHLIVSNEYGEADFPFMLLVIDGLPDGLYIMPDPADVNWEGVEGSGMLEDPYIVRSEDFNVEYALWFSFVANSQPDGSGTEIDVATLSWGAYPPFIVEDPNWAAPGMFQANNDGFTNGYVFAESGEPELTSNYAYILSLDVLP